MTKRCPDCGPTVAFDDHADLCMHHGTVLTMMPAAAQLRPSEAPLPDTARRADPQPASQHDERHATMPANPIPAASVSHTPQDEAPSGANNMAPQGLAPQAPAGRAVPPRQFKRSSPEPETHVDAPTIWDRIKSQFGKNEPNPILPQELAARFQVTGPMVNRGHTEVWPVTSASSGQKAWFLRHKVAPVTSEALYDRIQAASLAAGHGLITHGVMEVGGVHYKYELVQYQRAGEAFPIWLSSPGSQPGESRAAWLLAAIHTEAKRWLALGMQPLYLHPNVLAVSPDGVIFADFSCMSEIPVQHTFNKDFGLLGPILAPYAAPEMLERCEVTPNSLVFSIGQLVWEAMLGTPLQYGTLRNATAIPFQGIDDAKLARQLMGLLFPEAAHRWTMVHLETIDATLPPWSRLHPDAATTSFAVASEHFWRAEDALDAALNHWDETCAEIDTMLSWLTTTRHAHLARAMQAARHSAHRSADWVLLRLQQAIRPVAPLVWRQYSLDDFDRTLTALGQAALAPGADAASARVDVQRFITADLRGATL